MSLNIHIFACRVFTRELSYLISQSKNIVDVTFLPQGLHETPQMLHAQLQEVMDRFRAEVESGLRRRKPDYLALAYGLCSESIVGLQAVDVPLIVPRVDDCIALFLGSEVRYLDLFDTYKGTYWAFPSWVESTPGTDADYLDKMRALYLERHDGDEDVVDMLMECEQAMLANYRSVGYISSELAVDPQGSRAHAQRYAETNGWEYLEFEGDLSLMSRLVNGPWNDDEFLIVPPGYSIASAPGAEKVCARL